MTLAFLANNKALVEGSCITPTMNFSTVKQNNSFMIVGVPTCVREVDFFTPFCKCGPMCNTYFSLGAMVHVCLFSVGKIRPDKLNYSLP